METIKQRLHGKIGLAVQAMHLGLIKYSNHPQFLIHMHVFGHKTDDPVPICMGCLATVASQQIAGKDLHFDFASSSTGRALNLGYDKEDLDEFEYAVEDFRLGDAGTLLEYFYDIYSKHDVDQDQLDRYNQVAQIFEAHEVDRYHILDQDYKDYIPKLQALAEHLIQNDL